MVVIQSLHALTALEWWEHVCSETTTNPTWATQQINDFRESDDAYNACKAFLQNPTSSPLAKFHAALVLSSVTLNKQWPLLSTTEKRELQMLIWQIISDGIQHNHYPTYVLNKIIQLLALLWKRGWHEYDDILKRESFTSISGVITSPAHQAIGCKMLRIVVEEFSSKSSAEIGLPLEFHRMSHESFQACGINEALQLSVQSLTNSLATVAQEKESIDRLLDAMRGLCEALKLTNAVMSWDFDNFDVLAIRNPRSTISTADEDKENTGRLNLPAVWAPILVNLQLLEHIFQGYRYLKSLMTIVPASCHETLFTCLADIRSLLSSLTSMAGDIFPSDQQKAEVVAFIATHACDFLEDQLQPGRNASIAIESIAEDRAKELEQFASLLQRALRNLSFQVACQLPCFERLMLTLGKTTYELARELRLMAEFQLHSQHGEGQLSLEHQQHLNQFDLSSAEPDLLNGWRGECIGILLDTWCLVLGHDSMLQSALITDLSGGQVAQAIKQGLQSIAVEVFVQLFECVLRTTLSDSLGNDDEDEDEDQEAIAVRSLDELLAGICTIGRTNCAAALEYICSTINQQLVVVTSAIDSNNSQLLIGKDSLKILETIRIAILFACHMIDDLFSTEEESRLKSETPSIPSFIVDSLAYNPSATINALHSLLNNMSQLLNFQLLVNTAPVNDTKASLQSPLILQLLMHFFVRYISRYVDANPTLYPASVVQCIPQLFSLHGAEFAAVIELLLGASCQIVLSLSMQQEVIKAMASVFIAFAESSNGARIEFLVGHPLLSQLFGSLFANGGSLSQLTADGLTSVYNALGALTMVSQADAFTQICTSVHSRGQRLVDQYQQAGRVVDVMMLELSQCIACLTGLASCARNEVRAKVVHELFNYCLPVVQKYIEEGSPTDAVLKAYVIMLRDYAESQLPIMNRNSSLVLYQCINLLLPLLSKRLTQVTVADRVSQLGQSEEAAFRSDLILLIFQLLNHLSTKDLVLDDEQFDPQDHSNSNELSLEALIGGMLLNGLNFFMPLMTPEFLRSFPLTCDRYFSFVSYFLSSYELVFADFIRGCGDNRTVLHGLCEQLLWGAGAVDETSARLALHALQSIATYQHKSLKEGGDGYGPAAGSILALTLNRLLRMLIFVDQSLQPAHFQETASDVIAQQPVGIQGALMDSFQQLLTNDGVDFTRMDRANRLKFVKNTKAFVVRVRPLVTYQ